MEDRKMKYYKTQNLYEAAYIHAKGCMLLGKESHNNKVSLFFGDDARQHGLDFYNGGEIEAKKYSDSYRTLKDYVFER